MNTLMFLAFNTMVFVIISKILPGFKIKSAGTAFGIAVLYSILSFFSAFLAVPIFGVLGFLFAMCAVIPIIGPLIAASGMLITIFFLGFIVSVVMLIIVDKLMEDFEMSSFGTAVGASFLFALFNVLFKFFLH